MAYSQTLFLHEFGIKETRYANYCIAVVGKVVISLLTLSCSKGMVSYPELMSFLCYAVASHRFLQTQNASLRSYYNNRKLALICLNGSSATLV